MTRHVEPTIESMTIEFEMHGQDFSFFRLAFAGIDRGSHDVRVPLYRVTEAGPFQNWLWKDKLLDGTTIIEQCRPAIQLEGGWKVLNYPIKRITEVRR